MSQIKTFNPSIPEGLKGKLYALLFNITKGNCSYSRCNLLGDIKINGLTCYATTSTSTTSKLWCTNRYIRIDKINNYFNLVGHINYSDVINPTLVNYRNGSSYNQACGEHTFSPNLITFYYNKDNSFSEITWDEPLKEISDKSYTSYSFDGSLAEYSNGSWNYIKGSKPSNLCCYMLFSILDPKPKRILWKD